MDRARRRDELLAAARDVLVERGYHDAKIDDIAARAKVGKGTYYLYFKDKKAIFAELVDGLVQRLVSAILRVDQDGDIEQQVRHNIRATLAVLAEDPELSRVILGPSAGLDLDFVGEIRDMHARVHAILARALRDGQELGLVAPGDPELCATFAIGAIKEVVLGSVDHLTPRKREELVDQLVAVLRAGFLRIDARPTSSASVLTTAPAVSPAPRARRARPRAR